VGDPDAAAMKVAAAPAVTEVEAGFDVTTGADPLLPPVTVSVTADVVVDTPAAEVKVAE